MKSMNNVTEYALDYVDYENPELPRVQKESAKLLAQVFSNNGFPEPKSVN